MRSLLRPPLIYQAYWCSMQLFAFSSDGKLVPVDRATPGQTYICPECSGPLKLRLGSGGIPNFYHPRRTKHCKSPAHLQVQRHLQTLLPGSILEHPFPTIGRIADVYWPDQKRIFEVQCSPITPREIAARNADYARLNCHVVWLLHDARYNKGRLTKAERSLQGQPHYYTDIDATGKGQIYLQHPHHLQT